MIIDLIENIKRRSRAVKLAALVAGVILIIWSVAGVDTSHAHTWFEKHIPGFWALFTICSSLILILVTRLLGKSGIQTREDYYDN